MRLIPFTVLMMMASPMLAGEGKVSNCGEPAIEADQCHGRNQRR